MRFRSYVHRTVHYVRCTQSQVQANRRSIGIGRLSLFCGQFEPIKIAPFKRLVAIGRRDVRRLIARLSIG